MPAARHCSRSPGIAFAVMAMIGDVPAGRRLAPADRARGLVAVHLRHLAVHQDDVVAACARTRLDRLDAVRHDVDAVARAARACARATFWFTGLSSATRTRSAGASAARRARPHGVAVPRAARRRAAQRARRERVVQQRGSRTGFVRQPSNARRRAARSASSARGRARSAATSGVRPGRGRPGSLRASSMPSIPGMSGRAITSSYGGSVAAAARSRASASAPRPPPRRRACPSAVAAARRIARLVALSSTTRTRRPGERRAWPASRPARAGRGASGDREPERAALPQPRSRRRSRRPSARRAACRCEPEPGAAVAAASSSVGLREGLEEPLAAPRAAMPMPGVAHLEADERRGRSCLADVLARGRRPRRAR